MRQSIFLNQQIEDLKVISIENDFIGIESYIKLTYQIDSINHDLRDLVALESIKTTVETTLNNNQGLDDPSLKMFHMTVNALMDRKDFGSVIESISTEGLEPSKISYFKTKVALESLTEKIKEFSARIVKAIREIWTKVKEYFKHLFEKKSIIQASISKQVLEINTINDHNYTGPKELKIPGISTESEITGRDLIFSYIPFGIKGECDYNSTKTIVKNTNLLINANADIVNDINACLNSIVKHRSHDGLIRDINNLVNDIKAFISKLQLKSKKIDGPREIYTYGYLVSGQVCELTEFVNRSHDEADPKLFNIEIRIEEDDNKPYSPSLLKKDQMAELGKLAIQLVENSKQIDRIIPEIDRVLNDNVRLIEESDESDNISLKTLQLINDLFKYTTHNLPKVSSDANKVAVCIGRYIKYCVAQYKEFEAKL